MPNGGYAEYAVAKASTAIPIPDHVTFEQAVVHHFNLPVAYLAYYVFGEIQPDETILVHSAAGGIGSLFVQIAKRRANNVVIGLVSTEDKVERCLANGADHAINTEACRLRRGGTAHHGRTRRRRVVEQRCRPDTAHRSSGDPDARAVAGQQLGGGQGAARSDRDHAEVVHSAPVLALLGVGRARVPAATAFLREWLATEQLDTPGRTFAFEDAAAAHTWMEERQSFGKVALVP